MGKQAVNLVKSATRKKKKLPSKYQINSRVSFMGMQGMVSGIRFTENEVFYDIKIDADRTLFSVPKSLLK